MKKITILFLLIASISFGQTTKTTILGHKYREYSSHPDKPLLIYLHGFSSNRTTPEQIDNEGFVRNFVSKYKENYTILAPFQPSKYWGWQGDKLPAKHDAVEFIEEILALYTSDGRLYVTGYSMGGVGTWDVLTLMGSKVTAFVVCAGRSDDYNGVRAVAKLKIPGRHYHGDRDNTQNSYAKGKQVTSWYAPENGNILITYYGYGHTDKGYTEPDLNEWFLSKGKPILPEPPGLYLDGKFCGTDSCKVDNHLITIKR